MFLSRLNNTNLSFWYWWILICKASAIFVSFSRHISRTVFGHVFLCQKTLATVKDIASHLNICHAYNFLGLGHCRLLVIKGIACKLFQRNCCSLFKSFKKKIKIAKCPPRTFPVFHLKDPQIWFCFGRGTQKCIFIHTYSHFLRQSIESMQGHCAFFW